VIPLFSRGRLGFGGAPLGNLYQAVDDAQAEHALAAAWELGLRYFDTAPLYGNGLSEQRIGRFLCGNPRDSYVLSSKVGRVLDADALAGEAESGYVHALRAHVRFDYSADGALRSIEDSLRRLGVDRLDIAYIHDIDCRTHGALQSQRFREAMEGAFPALQRLRDEGVLRAVGLGVNETQPCIDALRYGDFDCFMVAGRFTLLDSSAYERLVPACATRGVRLVVAGAYNSGILACGAVPGARYDYGPASAATLARVARLEGVARRYDVPLRAAALQFALGSPVVSQVMVGVRSAEEMIDSAAMFRHPIPAAFWNALQSEGLLAQQIPVPATVT
jgi:D-threo-aldose 1-dehydrogenase